MEEVPSAKEQPETKKGGKVTFPPLLELGTSHLGLRPRQCSSLSFLSFGSITIRQ
jgi:hypothetical protein